MRHFTQIADFSKKDILEIYRRAKQFQKGGDFTHLAPGKVLGLGFFQESTRTAAGFQSAIIRLGGGWLGITSPTGSYVGSGEETVETTLLSLAEYADIMAVRHGTFDLTKFAPKSTTPLMNGMCGGDEHSQAGLSFLFTVFSHRKTLEGITVGFYGMVKSSRPAKALINVLANFGATIYEDSVVDGFQTPSHIRDNAEKGGCKLIRSKFEDFIGKVDFLFIVEGLPQKGEDENMLQEYSKKFKIFGGSEIKLMKRSSLVAYGMPAKLTDGRSIIREDEIGQDPCVIESQALRDLSFVNMALITFLLNIPVGEAR